MSAWVKQGTEPTIGLIRDFVDPEFTDYLAKVIDEYCEFLPSLENSTDQA